MCFPLLLDRFFLNWNIWNHKSQMMWRHSGSTWNELQACLVIQWGSGKCYETAGFAFSSQTPAGCGSHELAVALVKAWPRHDLPVPRLRPAQDDCSLLYQLFAQTADAAIQMVLLRPCHAVIDIRVVQNFCQFQSLDQVQLVLQICSIRFIVLWISDRQTRRPTMKISHGHQVYAPMYCGKVLGLEKYSSFI